MLMLGAYAWELMTEEAAGAEKPRASIVVIMGVSGAGKTTIGSMLADTLGWQFADADSFHPPANIQKMTNGVPLEDADRGPWLDALRACILNWLDLGRHGILACSALKHSYREALRVDDDRVAFVYLKASPEVLAERLKKRVGHYMKPEMLKSQLETLEEPIDAIYIDANSAPMDIVNAITRELKLVE